MQFNTVLVKLNKMTFNKLNSKYQFWMMRILKESWMMRSISKNRKFLSLSDKLRLSQSHMRKKEIQFLVKIISPNNSNKKYSGKLIDFILFFKYFYIIIFI